jgi:peptidoglycan/LPS O-acetylase OafA/YrhL
LSSPEQIVAGTTPARPEAAIHSDRRLPALTGLRMVAALAVYMNHIGAPEGSPAFLSAFMSSGYSGVTIFFVLSGFVLAFNYLESMRRPSVKGVYNYFVARFARVYPLYLLVLFFVVVRQHAQGAGIDGWWRNALAIQTWDPNLFHAFAFVGPAWSVSVEFFLYACFPLLIPLLGRLRRPRTILLTAAAVAVAMLALVAAFVISGHGNLSFADPGSAHRWLYRTPLTRLGDFALGILAALLFVQVRGQEPYRRLGAPLAILAAVAIAALMAWPALFITAWSWDVAYALPAVVLIFALAIAPSGLLARGLSLGPVVLLGEASYAFYLVHSPALGFLGGGIWAETMSFSVLLNEICILGAIVALAVGLHITVERPARQHLRNWLTIGRRRRSLT